MASKANSAFVRDYTQNTIERQRARAEEILASSDDVMQKIAKLPYNDFSDRDIVDHILKNGSHIANIIEDDSQCDADGNTFIDFIESDNNFYFNGLAQCLKEINKPENAQLKAENRERIGKVGRAVFLWNRLNDLIGVLAGVEKCQTAEELAESYSEVEDFILNCAEYMRASSSSPHASAAADKYCERQTARLRKHFEEYADHALFGAAIDIINGGDAPLENVQKLNDGAGPGKGQATARIAAAAAGGTFAGSAAGRAETAVRGRGIKSFIKDKIFAVGKAPSDKLLPGFWLMSVGTMILAVGLMFLGGVAILLGIFVAAFSIGWVGVVVYSYMEGKYRKVCKSCKKVYDLDREISYEEISRESKTYKYNPDHKEVKQRSEEVTAVFRVHCRCSNCGTERTYDKKFPVATGYHDGSWKTYNTIDLIEQYYRAPVFGTSPKENKIALIITAVAAFIGIVLMAVGIPGLIANAVEQAKFNYDPRDYYGYVLWRCRLYGI